MTRVLILHDYFLPARYAGGPVTSLASLLALIGDDLDIHMAVSARDADGASLEVDADQWLSRPGYRIRYGRRSWSFLGIYRVLKEVEPEVIYINGVYSIVGYLAPLIATWLLRPRVQIVVCPRGMLMPSAVGQKRFRKLLFLLASYLPARRQITWHMTSQGELDSFPAWYRGREHEFVLLQNCPRTVEASPAERKHTDILHLTTVALITPMKNFVGILEALASLRIPIEYTVVGPVVDQDYWQRCLELIDRMPTMVQVRHLGYQTQAAADEIVRESDLYLQPSLSENFGQSIFDALQLGVPVLTSHTTPWHEISDAGCGYVVESDSKEQISASILDFAARSEVERNEMRVNARSFAEAYLEKTDLKQKYLDLLSPTR